MHCYIYLDKIMSGLVSNTSANEMEILWNMFQVPQHLTLLIHKLLQTLSHSWALLNKSLKMHHTYFSFRNLENPLHSWGL